MESEVLPVPCCEVGKGGQAPWVRGLLLAVVIAEFPAAWMGCAVQAGQMDILVDAYSGCLPRWGWGCPGLADWLVGWGLDDLG